METTTTTRYPVNDIMVVIAQGIERMIRKKTSYLFSIMPMNKF